MVLNRASRTVFAVCLLSVLLGAALLASRHHRDVSIAPVSQTSVEELENGDLGDWKRPFTDSQPVGDVSAAASELPFTPTTTVSLGRLEAAYIHQKAQPRARQAIALVFDHQAFGEYVVIEAPTQAKPDVLAEMARNCTKAAGCVGEWQMVNLARGIRGLLVTGPASNGIIWIKGKVLFDLYGPTDSFQVDAATTLASSLSAA